MHGQRRDEYKARFKDEATVKKLEKKALTWNKISAEILVQRKNLFNVSRDTIANGGGDSKGDNNADISPSGSNTVHHKVALGLTEKLLTVNPDPVYLWNHRREVLLDIFKDRDGGDNAIGSSEEFIQNEQVLTQAALQRNPKAYGAWFHRKWAIRHYLTVIEKAANASHAGVIRLLKSELGLCGEFLMLDERNFHCWNYRRYIVGTLMSVMAHEQNDSQSLFIDGGWNFHALLDDNASVPAIGAQLTGSPPSSTQIEEEKHNCTNTPTATYQNDLRKLLQSELDFTTDKIEQNFSNGSAFHQRSKLLPLLLELDAFCFSYNQSQRSSARAEIFERELELVRNAVFTEPDDQTSWWYFRFILDWAIPPEEYGEESIDEDENYRTAALVHFQKVLYEEWQTIQELVESEDGNCKWGLLGLHMIAKAFLAIEEGNRCTDEDWDDLAKSYLVQLKELDPDRSRRYETLMVD